MSRDCLCIYLGGYIFLDLFTPPKGFQNLDWSIFRLRECKSLRESSDVCNVSQQVQVSPDAGPCTQSVTLTLLTVMSSSSPLPHFWDALFTSFVSSMWPSTLTPLFLGLPPYPGPLPAICRAQKHTHCSRDANNTAHGCKPLCRSHEAFLTKITGHLFIPGTCIFVTWVSWEFGKTCVSCTLQKSKRFNSKSATKIFRPSFCHSNSN